MIVIAGPKQPLIQPEVDLLKSYLDQGGALVVMVEPLPVTDFGDSSDPLAEYLAEDWTIFAGNDVVVDLTSQQPFAPYAASYGSSPITEDIKNTVTQFPTARSMSVLTETVSGVSPVELVFTAPQSWAEMTLDNLAEGTSEIAFDPEKDKAGPISLAVSAENFNSNARLVAFGDSDFILDTNFVYFANGDLIVNAIDWAAGQEDLISLTPKSNTQRTLITSSKCGNEFDPPGNSNPGSRDGSFRWGLGVLPAPQKDVISMVRRSTLVLVLIFVALLGSVFYLQHSESQKEALITPTEENPLIFNFTAEIKGISIERVGSGIVELTKNNQGAWSLKSRETEEVDVQAVESAMSQLLSSRVVSALGSELALKEAGLDPPVYRVVIFLADESKSSDVRRKRNPY